MEFDSITPADAGAIVLYRLSFLDFADCEDTRPCIAYCAMKRPGGLLLCVPSAAFFLELLEGPHTTVTVQAVGLTDSGDWARSFRARNVDALLIHLDSSAARGLSPLEGTEGLEFFCEDDPSLYPLTVDVVSMAQAWLVNVAGERGSAGYVTAEEALASDPPPRSKLNFAQRKAEPKTKRHTVASVAAEQASLTDLVSHLARQVQTLVEQREVLAPNQPLACVTGSRGSASRPSGSA